jgi:DNA-binding beta-propeller fold protein YncE
VLTVDGSRIIKTIPLGDAPFVIASAPVHRRLYVGNNNTSFVYVLRDVAGVEEPQSPRPGLCGALSVAPNPFTRSVTIVWNSLTKGGGVARVYAQDGRLVKQAQILAGESRWVWDGRDDSGATLPPGVYVLETGSGVRAKAVKLK